MAFASFLVFLCLLNFSHFLTATDSSDSDQQNTLQTYIVHVESQSNDLDSLYDSFLEMFDLDTDAGDQPRIVHRYRDVFKGFAVRLSEEELESMSQMDGFVSAHPEQMYQLLTTHSPNFLGLNRNAGLWKDSNYGKGVIIGLLDSGITPDHPSFSDKDMPPPPAKWKGKCDFSGSACNNKLIGARRFGSMGLGTPADKEGHGTHTSSTAGGNFVSGANILGNANGTAAGMAPLAHVAMYGVCGPLGCSESGILAGIDAAIHDGVDILSMSLGAKSVPFYSDSIALGAFRAMEKGILVSCAAGNSGPNDKTLSNEAPWILTVGASTIDRKLTSTVVLGNGEELDGESAFQPRDFDSTKEFELVYPETKVCGEHQLTEEEAKGKIVICDMGSVGRVAKGESVKKAGGAGMILANSDKQGSTTFAEAHVLPASHISYSDATKLKSYLNSTQSPKAKIVFKGTTIGGDKSSPAVAFFSSRGPSVASPGILKPDILGPGNNIIAAWNKSPSNNSTTKDNYNMISGTSMACPHLSGIAALLKSAHPSWSPAAIKSAIMTTADQVNLGGKPFGDQSPKPANIFATGAGHVNPLKATDPGLIYDIQPDDYIPYLCGLKYTNKQVSLIVQRQVECTSSTSILEAQLNYPSFSFKAAGNEPQTYTRTVTNVGEADSLYQVKIDVPSSVTVTVKPTTLQFSKVGEKLKYSVTVTTQSSQGNKIAKGAITWTSDKHSVISPIAFVF